MNAVEPHSAALLVIDVQRGMDDPSRPPRNNPDAEANIARLLAALRASNVRCVHVQHHALDPASPFAPDQPGHPIKDIAAPLPDEWLIVKHVNSAFIGTDLEARLRANGITTLILTGTATNYCVESTARMAGNLGFDTYVVSDATAAWDRLGPDGIQRFAADIHAYSLSSLHEEFATIVTTDDVLAALPAPPP